MYSNVIVIHIAFHPIILSMFSEMPFSKFVEIGRVAMLNEGPDAGKIAAIVNVIDQNRVLIDGPTSGVARQAYPIKQLHLTPLRVKFAFNAKTKVVRQELEAGKVNCYEIK